MVKQLGAIAALQRVVAFNTEVADELRAVFDDFRSTSYGQAFEVDPVENFRTNNLGRSSFTLYNRTGDPEYCLHIDIHSSGETEVAIKTGKNTSALLPELEQEDGISIDLTSIGDCEIAAAKVIGSVIGLEQTSSFAHKFRDYVQDRIIKSVPQAVPVADQFNREP